MTNIQRFLLLVTMCGVGLSASAEAKQPRRAAAPPVDGKAVYDRWCSACHEPGIRSPGTAALTAKYGKDQPGALRLRKDLTPELISYFVRNGVLTMPYFRKTEISDAELAALGKYLSKGTASQEVR